MISKEAFHQICLRSRETSAYSNVAAIDKIRETKCCVIGMEGVGLEVVKNLALSGMENIHVMDDRKQKTNHNTFFARAFYNKGVTNAKVVAAYMNDHLGEENIKVVTEEGVQVENYDLVIMIHHREPYVDHEALKKQCKEKGIGFIAVDYKGIAFTMEGWRKGYTQQGLRFEFLKQKHEVILEIMNNLNAFYRKHDKLPRTFSKEASQLAKHVPEKFHVMARNICMCADGDFVGMTNLVGGTIAQDAIRFVLAKEKLHQYEDMKAFPFFVDESIVPPQAIQQECLKMKDYHQKSPYERMVGPSVIGKAGKMNILQVGAGALGCELLKNHIMMGIKMGDILDFDAIELSNTTRQFYFKKSDIGKNKAVVGVQKAKWLHAEKDLQFHAKEEMLKCNMIEEEAMKEYGVFISAVDNKIARYLLKRAALFHQLPMVDGGTEGFMGRADSVVPHCSYEQLRYTHPNDEKKIEKKKPSCSLKQNPSAFVDCVPLAIELIMNEFLYEFPKAYAEGIEEMTDSQYRMIRYEVFQDLRRMKEISENQIQEYVEMMLRQHFMRDDDDIPHQDALVKLFIELYKQQVEHGPSSFNNNQYEQVVAVYYLAQCFAKIYDISGMMEFREYCNMLYNKSIPALISTTSMVTGLMSSNILKLIYQQCHPNVEMSWNAYTIPDIWSSSEQEQRLIDQTWQTLHLHKPLVDHSLKEIQGFFGSRKMKSYNGTFIIDQVSQTNELQPVELIHIQNEEVTFLKEPAVSPYLLRFVSSETEYPTMWLVVHESTI